MHGRKLAAALTIAALVALSASTPAHAVVVPCPAATGAQLDAAIADPDCNPINLAAGTLASPTAQYVINRSVTLQGAGSAATTLVPQNATFNVLQIANPVTVTLNDLALTGGTSGLFVNSGGPTINMNRTSVRGNSGSGSGIDLANGTATLNLTNSTVDDNHATVAGGGGLYNFGTMNLTNVTVSNNSAVLNGGGLNNQTSGAVANLTNVTFKGNSSDANGGAMQGGSGATIAIKNSTIVGNTADDDADETASFENGGGIGNGGGTVTIRNSILSGNFDDSPGGGSHATDCAATITRLGYVLVGNPALCTFGGAGDTATGYVTGVDPKLSPLAEAGGPVDTMVPLPGSPMLDAIPSGACLTATDARGISRPQNGSCDLGATERQAIPPLPFRNPAAISIPAVGAAAPFPSVIDVSGLAGAVTGVTVRLDGLSHTYQGDLQALLVGPQGQSTLLFSDIADAVPHAIGGSTVTFSDTGAPLPTSSSMLSTTYKPGAQATAPTFAAGAPAGPFGATLSVFAGSAPNGAWKLFVQDDNSGDLGTVAGGWSLDVTTPAPPAKPVAAKKCKKKRKGKKSASASKCKKKKRKK